MREQVRLRGAGNWAEIARHVGTRTAPQCLQRWTQVLDPSLEKGAFTTEEDEKIRQHHAELGGQWGEIAKHLPGRTGLMVRNRWKSLNKAARRQPTTTSSTQPTTTSSSQPTTASSSSQAASSTSSSTEAGKRGRKRPAPAPRSHPKRRRPAPHHGAGPGEGANPAGGVEEEVAAWEEVKVKVEEEVKVKVEEEVKVKVEEEEVKVKVEEEVKVKVEEEEVKVKADPNDMWAIPDYDRDGDY